jgi:hypothetical protein
MCPERVGLAVVFRSDQSAWAALPTPMAMEAKAPLPDDIVDRSIGGERLKTSDHVDVNVSDVVGE